MCKCCGCGPKKEEPTVYKCTKCGKTSEKQESCCEQPMKKVEKE